MNGLYRITNGELMSLSPKHTKLVYELSGIEFESHSN